MRQMTDEQLLGAYVREGSQAAFGEIVGRYTDLVYGAARRQGSSATAAEDVTQAVFMILARKAETLKPGTILAGWLVYTARYAAISARRREVCRREHEGKAATMRKTESTRAPEQDVTAVLDEALVKLPTKERDAVVLRYLQKKSFSELSAVIGISEDAAKKRVTRAVEKLRGWFAKKMNAGGMSAVGVMAVLEQMPRIVAPTGLSQHIAGAVFTGVHGGVLASSNAAAIAKGTIHMMTWAKVPFAAAMTGLGVMLVGAMVAVMLHGMAMPVSGAVTQTSAETKPVAVENVVAAHAIAPPSATPYATLDTEVFRFSGDSDKSVYMGEIDPNVQRTPDSPPAGHIKVIGTVTDNAKQMRGAMQFQSPWVRLDVKSLRGKRVRMVAWAKTVGITNWAGFQLGFWGKNGRIGVYDMMPERPIRGTTDWTEYELVMDVPTDTTWMIATAAIYRGSGEMWFDDVQLEEVGNDTPTTDDTTWHLNGSVTPQYSRALDPKVVRNGHPTMCITSVAAKDWNLIETYGVVIRDGSPYLGKRVRMKVMMRGQGDILFGPYLRVRNGGDITMNKGGGEDRLGPLPFMTGAWSLYQVEADVPKDACNLSVGIGMTGPGKIWVDDYKLEIIGDAKSTAANEPAMP